MNRRQFVTAIGGAGLIGIVGLSQRGVSLSSHETLPDPTITHNGNQTYLTYLAGGKRLTSVSIAPSSVRVKVSKNESLIRTMISIWHRQTTQITSLRIKLKAPPGAEPPEVISLSNRGSFDQPRRFYTKNGYTILEEKKLGLQGEGTLSSIFELPHVKDSTQQIYVDFEYNLTDGEFLGHSYRVKGQTTAPLPTRKA